MSELPDDPTDLTPDQAREAPAGPETDWLVADLLGWRLTETHPRECWGPSHKMTNGDESFVIQYGADKLKAREGIPEQLAFSRDPRAAHRARQWLREQGFEISLHDYAACARFPSDDCDRRRGERRIKLVDAVTSDEQLLTARLLLLLAAEGVLEANP